MKNAVKISFDETVSCTGVPCKQAERYDRISFYYDFIAGIFESKYRKAGLKVLNPQAGEKILEIGCGTGKAAVFIARKVGITGKYQGVDISSKMLYQTAKRLIKKELLMQSQLVKCDALNFSCPEASFDKVFISFTIELFNEEEILVILDKCRHVLIAEGKLVIVSLSRRGKRNLMVRLYENLQKKFPEVIDCRFIPAKDKLIQCGFEILQLREMSLAGIPVDIILAQKSS